jgi:hypothetical protein
MQCVLGYLGRGWRRCPGFLDFRESKEARYAQPEASAKSINRAKDELVRVQSAENVIEDLRVIAHAKVVADAEADVDVDVDVASLATRDCCQRLLRTRSPYLDHDFALDSRDPCRPRYPHQKKPPLLTVNNLL